MASDEPWPVPRWRAWTTLIILGLLYVVSFVDRFILALLVQPLKADLGVSDLQLGLLFGTAFALFYAVLGLPFARMADRSNRWRLVVAGATLWSLSTIASGFATSYGWLVALRIGLAIGEAALTPSAFSMIGDLFPARERRRAGSIYSAFGMVGAGGGYVIGGLIIAMLASSVGSGAAGDMRLWQWVFIAVGTPSLLLTLVFALLVREPVRIGAGAVAASLGDVRAYVLPRLGLLASLILGAGLCQIPAYAMIAWMPYMMQTRFGIPTAEVGFLFGMTAIVATAGGTLLLPWLSDRLERLWGAATAARLSALAAAGAVLALLLAARLQAWAPFLLLSGTGLLLLTGGANNILVGLQTLVPAQMRATFAALCLLSITLLGLGVGPPALAAIRTAMGDAQDNALALLAAAAALPAALLLEKAARLLRRAPDGDREGA